MSQSPSPDFIRRGRDFLLSHSWGQGCYHAYCAIGALAYGNNTGICATEDRPEVPFLQQLIDGQTLAAWNDMDGRTKEDVVALFNRALEQLGVAP